MKLHGDYMDSRLKNTPAELAKYDRHLTTALRRVLDEFGLIICGWSAEWDAALCAELGRCRNQRYATYWTLRSEPGVHTQKLIGLRRPQMIRIKDADSFFESLASQLAALDDLDHPHPISTEIAVAQAKRYLVRHEDRIALNDLVMGEVEKACALLTGERFPAQSPSATREILTERVEAYEGISSTSVALVATGCYWGDDSHDSLWTKVLEVFASSPPEVPGNSLLLHLRQYPTLLALYASGLGAIAAERYGTLAALLTRPSVISHGHDPGVSHKHDPPPEANSSVFPFVSAVKSEIVFRPTS